MRCFGIVSGCAVVAAAVVFTSTAPVFADHLDRIETRQIVRHVEERSDALQDRIYHWMDSRHEGHKDREVRQRHADEMLHAAEEFDHTLAQFKLDLYNHDEPWELRNNAQYVLNAAAEFSHAVDRTEWRGELRQEADDFRETANELARHYRLPEIPR